jgi:hypothetical protein
MNDQPIKRVVEMHYTVQEIATLIRKCDRYVRDRIKRGDFGPDSFYIDGDYVVAASAVNAWLEKFRLLPVGVKARNEAELRRKLAAAQAAADGT